MSKDVGERKSHDLAEGSAAIPPEEGTMDEPVRNWQEWAEQHSEAADILRRLRDALEAAAGGYGPVTDEQRNEWLALVAEVDAKVTP